MRVFASTFVVLDLLLAATSAHATPSARLVYARGAGAETCGDESDLRRAVATRLGYDPFFPWAAQTVTATLSREGGTLHGEATLVDDHGALRGRRALTTGLDGCRELLDAMALAISIAIDPLAATGAPAPPVAAPPPPRDAPPREPPRDETHPLTPAAPPAPPPPTEAPPREPAPVAVTAGVGLLGTLGAAPAPSFGITLFGALRWPTASVGLEGRADLPASKSVAGGGSVNASLLVGSAVPCLHTGPLFGCAIVSVGSFNGRSDGLAVSRNATAFYAAGGARAGVEVPLTAFVSARFHADLLATFTRNGLAVDGATAYTAPPLSISAGAGVVVRF